MNSEGNDGKKEGDTQIGREYNKGDSNGDVEQRGREALKRRGKRRGR